MCYAQSSGIVLVNLYCALPYRNLKSPIVELVVGEGEDTSVLSAHQALLSDCPFFAEKLAESSVRDSFSQLSTQHH